MTYTQKLRQKIKKLARSLGCSVWPQYGPSGFCPVQAEGRICLPNSKPASYYFRARGQNIRMEFNSPNPDKSFCYHESVEGEFAAGYLDTDQVMEFIARAIRAWKTKNGR